MKGARQERNKSPCPLPSVQALEKRCAGKEVLRAEGQKGQIGGTEEEVGGAVLSTGEVKEGGS